MNNDNDQVKVHADERKRMAVERDGNVDKLWV